MTPAEVKALTLGEFNALAVYQQEYVKAQNKAVRDGR